MDRSGTFTYALASMTLLALAPPYTTQTPSGEPDGEQSTQAVSFLSSPWFLPARLSRRLLS